MQPGAVDVLQCGGGKGVGAPVDSEAYGGAACARISSHTDPYPGAHPTPRMADLFISYARADQNFVRALSAALEQRQRQAWVDWEGIPPSAEWMAEIEAAIDAADTFLFVISPDALASPVCALELEHAMRRNKRLVPLVRHDAADSTAPAALSRLNWIFLREHDDFGAGVDTLIAALDTDLDHVGLHTRYLVRAADWERKGCDAGDTLRGRDLAAAEDWLAHSGDKEPVPSTLHNRYILDSRRMTTRRHRFVGAAIGAGLLVAATLGLLALQQGAAKRQNQQRSIANQLIGLSRLASEQERVQLAAEAMRRFDALGERFLAADQELRLGLAQLPPRLPPQPVPDVIAGGADLAAFSVTGAFVATSSLRGSVVVHDVVAGTARGHWTLPLDAGAVLRAIAIDPAGERVAFWVRGSDGLSRVSLWDVARAAEVVTCRRDRGFIGRSVELDADAGLWFGSETWGLADCRDASTWPRGLARHRSITVSADGRRMAASVRDGEPPK